MDYKLLAIFKFVVPRSRYALHMKNVNFLTACDTASRMGVSPGMVTRLANAGDLPFKKVGARKVFDVERVDKYLRDRNMTPAPVDHIRHTVDLPPITAVSFFSGAGGLDLGMENAGITPLLYCENNRECRMTINHNRPQQALLGDINNVSADDVLSMARIPKNRGVDVMFGGPPCQAFSTAGALRAFNDPRGNVFLQFLQLANTLRPRYLVIENVRGLLSTPYPLTPNGKPIRGGVLRTILNKLTDMGYTTSFNLYNAANFGAAQIRERVVIIAKRDGEKCHWLTPTNSQDPAWGLAAWKTFREAVSNVETKNNHHTDFPEKRLKYFRLLKAGECWNSLPDNLKEEAMGKAYRLGGGKTGFYRRISWDRPAPTLVTSPTMPATDLCHPSEDRPLSVEEYKRIQGFPDNWWIAGDINAQYRQIGNAVPVKLGEAIGRAVLKDMSCPNDTYAWGKFPFSRYSHTSDESWNLGVA